MNRIDTEKRDDVSILVQDLCGQCVARNLAKGTIRRIHRPSFRGRVLPHTRAHTMGIG